MTKEKRSQKFNRVRTSFQPLYQAKDATLRSFYKMGHTHPYLKYPLFAVTVLFLFVYHLTANTLIQMQVREKLSKSIALILSLSLVLTSLNFSVSAIDSLTGNTRKCSGGAIYEPLTVDSGYNEDIVINSQTEMKSSGASCIL